MIGDTGGDNVVGGCVHIEEVSPTSSTALCVACVSPKCIYAFLAMSDGCRDGAGIGAGVAVFGFCCRSTLSTGDHNLIEHGKNQGVHGVRHITHGRDQEVHGKNQ